MISWPVNQIDLDLPEGTSRRNASGYPAGTMPIPPTGTTSAQAGSHLNPDRTHRPKARDGPVRMANPDLALGADVPTNGLRDLLSGHPIETTEPS